MYILCKRSIASLTPFAIFSFFNFTLNSLLWNCSQLLIPYFVLVQLIIIILIELHPFYFRPLLHLGKIFPNSIPAVQSACRSSLGIQIVCTPLSKSWIKVSYNALGGDPGEFCLMHPSTEPWDSHVGRVVVNGGQAVFLQSCHKAGMKSSTNVIT